MKINRHLNAAYLQDCQHRGGAGWSIRQQMQSGGPPRPPGGVFGFILACGICIPPALLVGYYIGSLIVRQSSAQ